jgi:folate-binding protein YgfZ
MLGILIVSGPDATEFLHNQLTVDLRGETPSIAAWCDAKGRVRAVFMMTRLGDDWSLALPQRMADTVLSDLQVFVLRSKVDLKLGEPLAWDALASIRAGLPQIEPETAADFLAPLLNLDLNGGLSWSKGCYPGQGVINRAHHLGSNKRRMFRFALQDAGPEPGTPVTAGDRQVGTVLYSAATDAGAELLAVVNLAALDEELTVDGRPLTRLDLPYVIPELG